MKRAGFLGDFLLFPDWDEQSQEAGLRSRNIKPGFFTNDELAELSPLTRLLFIGMWCMADREGRLKDRPKKIKAEILPFDECDVEEALEGLCDAFIIRYESHGHKYIQITKFLKHQNPHHMEAPSEIPPPDGVENTYNHKPVTKEQRLRIFKRDKNTCVQCGSKELLHIDHIRPISEGGNSDDENLQTLCRQCNLGKGKRWVKSVDKASTDSPQTDNAPLIPDCGLWIEDCGLRIVDNHIPDSDETPKTMKMTINDFSFLYSDKFGGNMPGGCRSIASELCNQFSKDSIIQAFDTASIQGKCSVAYVKGVLMGNGNLTKQRDPPKTFEQIKLDNTKQAMMEFVGEDYDRPGQEAICNDNGRSGGCFPL